MSNNNSQPKTFKQILSNEGKSALENLGTKAVNKLKKATNMSGSGYYGSAFLARNRLHNKSVVYKRKRKGRKRIKRIKGIKTGRVRKRIHSSRIRRKKTLSQLGTGKRRRRRSKKTSCKKQRQLDIFN